MQESVTILNFKKWPKPRKMLAILLAALFLFILMIGVIIALSVNSKKYYFADEKQLYVYYADIESSLVRAKQRASEIASAGGAGVVLSSGEKFYICAFVYSNEADAKTIKERNKTNFPNSGVLIKKTQKLTSRAKKVLKNDEDARSCVHLLEDLFNKFWALSVDIDKNNLGEVKVFNTVFGEYEKVAEKASAMSDIHSIISYTYDDCASVLKEFLSKADTFTERSSGVKKLCFEMVKIYNNLADVLNNT